MTPIPNPALNVAVVGACPYPAPQGSQVYMRDTAMALRSLGHDVRLIVYGHGVGDDDSGVPVHRCPNVVGAKRTAAGPSLGKPVLDALMVRTLRRVVREHSVDVVDAHNYEGLLVALAARTRPIVYHAHNAMADELPYYTRGKTLARRVGRWLDANFPRRADRVVVPHQALADFLIGCGCDPDRVAVIPPSADASAFEPCTERIDSPPVLYAGNLDEYQNLPFLFRAMDRIRESQPETRLVIATAAVTEGSKLSGHAEVVSTPDFGSLRTALSRDAVFVCPRVSWSGYPIKLLNAMAAGQAIVCCESAAHPITHEVDGLVVPDNDEFRFAETVLRLLRDSELRAALGSKARASVMRNNNPESVARDLSTVFESCTA